MGNEGTNGAAHAPALMMPPRIFIGKSPARDNRVFSPSGRHIRPLMVSSSDAIWADPISFVVACWTQNQQVSRRFTWYQVRSRSSGGGENSLLVGASVLRRVLGGNVWRTAQACDHAKHIGMRWRQRGYACATTHKGKTRPRTMILRRSTRARVSSRDSGTAIR